MHDIHLERQLKMLLRRNRSTQRHHRPFRLQIHNNIEQRPRPRPITLIPTNRSRQPLLILENLLNLIHSRLVPKPPTKLLDPHNPHQTILQPNRINNTLLMHSKIMVRMKHLSRPIHLNLPQIPRTPLQPNSSSGICNKHMTTRSNTTSLQIPHSFLARKTVQHQP